MQREFLDPATMPPGTRVTVAGEVTGSVILSLDETEYTFPVVDARRIAYMGPGPYWAVRNAVLAALAVLVM
jgi:outer membrane lipoprotein